MNFIVVSMLDFCHCNNIWNNKHIWRKCLAHSLGVFSPWSVGPFDEVTVHNSSVWWRQTSPFIPKEQKRKLEGGEVPRHPLEHEPMTQGLLLALPPQAPLLVATAHGSLPQGLRGGEGCSGYKSQWVPITCPDVIAFSKYVFLNADKQKAGH